MVYRVVSTKLTEEEHNKLVDLSTKKGCTPSALIKEAIIEKMQRDSDVRSQEQNNYDIKNMTLGEALREYQKLMEKDKESSIKEA